MRKNLWLAVGVLALTTILTGCATSAGAGDTGGSGAGLSEWPAAATVAPTATLTPFPKVTPAATATATATVVPTAVVEEVADDSPAAVSADPTAEGGAPAIADTESPDVTGDDGLQAGETGPAVLPDLPEAAKVQVNPAGGLRQVEVFAGPGTQFSPVGTVVFEDKVSVLGVNGAGDWVLIKPVADYTNPGWVARDHLEIGDVLESVPEVVTGWVNSHGVPVRAAPSLTEGQVGTLALNDMVAVAGVDGSRQWALVTPVLAGGSYVWAPFQFIDLGWEWAALPEATTAVATTPGDIEQTSAIRVRPLPEPLGIIVLQIASGGDIVLINQDGTGLRELTTGIDPVLSPDGTQVAFTRWEYGGELGSLWTINVDGSNERQILGEMRKAKGPDWAPDGSHIVVNYQAGGTLVDQQVCKALSGNPSVPANARDIKVKTTKDGPYLCWMEPADAHWRLRVVNVADGSFQDVGAGLYASRPAWDPYRVERIVSDSGYGLMESYPGDGTTLGITNDPNEGSPVFSPDGRFIASVVYQGGTYEIHRLNGDGTGRARLTATPLWVTAAPGDQKAWRNVAPAWSPDGTQIAFVTDRDGRWEVWVMDADGSNPHALFSDEVNARLPIQYNLVDERVLSWR